MATSIIIWGFISVIALLFIMTLSILGLERIMEIYFNNES